MAPVSATGRAIGTTTDLGYGLHAASKGTNGNFLCADMTETTGTTRCLHMAGQGQSGNIWEIRYPLEGGAPGDGIVVATTRPETLLGDTAVAVHPDDPRYAQLIGKRVISPFVDRAVPILGDDFVDQTFGTGAVKVTPAHDPNDREVGLRHNLPAPTILDEAAHIVADAPKPFAGMERFAARKAIVAALDALGLLVSVKPHTANPARCQR